MGSSPASRLQTIADWIDEGGEGSVREPDSDELRSIAVEVEALEAFTERREAALERCRRRERALIDELRDAPALPPETDGEPDPDPEYDVNVDPADHSTHLCPQDDCPECEDGVPEGTDDIDWAQRGLPETDGEVGE